MIGSQALIGYKDSTGVTTVKTFNVSGYSIAPLKIDMEVVEMEGEYSNGVMRIYASMILPKSYGSVVYEVWQVGPSVRDGIPAKHDFEPVNMKALGVLDLSKGGHSVDKGGGGALVDAKLKNKNIHGILNVVSWGIMFPFGIILARYLKVFQSADPAWFYLHVFSQFSAYVIGVAGWVTGLKLGTRSKGVQYTTHKKEHKLGRYWNYYHHGVGMPLSYLVYSTSSKVWTSWFLKRNGGMPISLC